jgi:hypothetical protein
MTTRVAVHCDSYHNLSPDTCFTSAQRATNTPTRALLTVLTGLGVLGAAIASRA